MNKLILIQRTSTFQGDGEGQVEWWRRQLLAAGRGKGRGSLVDGEKAASRMCREEAKVAEEAAVEGARVVVTTTMTAVGSGALQRLLRRGHFQVRTLEF